MNYPATIVLAGISMLAGAVPRQSPRGLSVEAVQLLAHPRTVSADSLDELRRAWSYHDYADTIVVRAVIAGDRAAEGSVVLGSVEFQAGRLRRSRTAGPATLTGDELSQLGWLPATQVFRVLMPAAPDARGKRLVVLGRVSPDSVLGTLRRSDPNILLVAMRVRVIALAAGSGGYARRQFAERIITLSLGD